ncbi:MAG: preprotein translocase subunit YajC [Candidatus Erginobacter occultus]|nr:preprotein translocase subunit YajC [Candidatus Erginobacter occultus]
MQYIPIAMGPAGGGSGGGCAPGGEGGQGGLGGMLIPLILMFAVFYFLLIRPQQKKQKEHQRMVSELQKGDRVITSGGIHGVISSVKDDTITVKVADNVKLEISRGNVSGVDKKSQ